MRIVGAEGRKIAVRRPSPGPKRRKIGRFRGELDHFTCFSTAFSTGVEILGEKPNGGPEVRRIETPDEDARAL